MPPLRSAQISYIGPLAGEVTVRAKKLRRGRKAAFVRSAVTGEAGFALSATFVSINSLKSQIRWNEAAAPDVPSFHEAGGDALPSAAALLARPDAAQYHDMGT